MLNLIINMANVRDIKQYSVVVRLQKMVERVSFLPQPPWLIFAFFTLKPSIFQSFKYHVIDLKC